MPLPTTLNPQQVTALASLQWLHSMEARREGRTTVQALVLLQQAVIYPGSWVRPVDHVPSHDTNQGLHRLCLDWAVELVLTFDADATSFRIMVVSPEARQLFEPYGLPVPMTVPCLYCGSF